MLPFFWFHLLALVEFQMQNFRRSDLSRFFRFHFKLFFTKTPFFVWNEGEMLPVFWQFLNSSPTCKIRGISICQGFSDSIFKSWFGRDLGMAKPFTLWSHGECCLFLSLKKLFNLNSTYKTYGVSICQGLFPMPFSTSANFVWTQWFEIFLSETGRNAALFLGGRKMFNWNSPHKICAVLICQSDSMFNICVFWAFLWKQGEMLPFQLHMQTLWIFIDFCVKTGEMLSFFADSTCKICNVSICQGYFNSIWTLQFKSLLQCDLSTQGKCCPELLLVQVSHANALKFAKVCPISVCSVCVLENCAKIPRSQALFWIQSRARAFWNTVTFKFASTHTPASATTLLQCSNKAVCFPLKDCVTFRPVLLKALEFLDWGVLDQNVASNKRS